MRYRALTIGILLLAGVWVYARHTPSPPAASAEPPIAWGIPANGVAVWVQPEHFVASLKEPFEFTVHTRNVGSKKVQVGFTNAYSDYRMLLLDANCRPVPVSKEVLDAEQRARKAARTGGTRYIYRCIYHWLEPGQEFTETFRLAEWFIVSKPGTYSLVLMRQVGPRNQGFAVANPLHLTLTK